VPFNFFTSLIGKTLLKRWRVPDDFPYYDHWKTDAVHKTPLDFRRQILQMQCANPTMSDREFKALIAEHPEYARNPLSAYVHRYDNGNPDATAPEKKIIFLHLQRTAGSTFTHVLRRNVRSIAFRRDFIGLPNESPIFALQRFRMLSEADKATEREKWEKYDAIADHCIYGMHEMMKSPPAYITILRHPVDRLLSYYRYIQRKRPDGTPDEEEASLARSLSITEFIHHPYFRLKLSLEQSAVQMIAGDIQPGGYVFGSQMKKLFEKAKEHLSSFDLVLLQEHFEESMQLLCAKYGWRDEFMTTDGFVPRQGETVGDVTRSSQAKAQLTEAEYQTLSEHLKWDIALYEFGRSLFLKNIHDYNIRLRSSEAPEPQTILDTSTMDMEKYPTSIGTVNIRLTWSEIAKARGFDPMTIDSAARHAYYTCNLRRDAFLNKASETAGAPKDLFRLWLLTLHGQNVCNNVIEQDVYGLRALKASGFSPKVIVDIGAHLGAFSLFAHSLWPKARIVAAEACSPDTLESDDINILKENLKDVTSDIHTTAIFGLLDGAHLSTCRAELARDTVDHWMELGVRGFPRFLGDVAAWRIKPEGVTAFFQRTNLDGIDLLKLSCDGAEVNILRELAATGMLEKIEEIRGEWHGEMGKKIPQILERTHAVTTTSIAPAHVRGTFAATRRPMPLPQEVVSEEIKGFATEAAKNPSKQEPVAMIAHQTSMGALYVHGEWEKTAKAHGIEPHLLHHYLSELYYKNGARDHALVAGMQRKFQLPETIVGQWMEYIHGQHICMHVIDRDCYGLQKLADGGFTPKTIVDVGGHIGTFILHSKALWPHARVISVEPTKRPSLVAHGDILRANTAHLSGVAVAPIALVGDLHNPERLTELQNDSFDHWLERGLRGDPRHTQKILDENIQAQSVLDFLQQYDITSIDLLKLDCEGSELNILRELSSLGMLKKIREIRGEWHGNLAKTLVPELLKTHAVTMESLDMQSGLFQATLL
jgi:FkbM family methyltransferase